MVGVEAQRKKGLADGDAATRRPDLFSDIAICAYLANSSLDDIAEIA